MPRPPQSPPSPRSSCPSDAGRRPAGPARAPFHRLVLPAGLLMGLVSASLTALPTAARAQAAAPTASAASTTPAAGEQAQRHDIPPGPLGAALNRFAGAAGIELTADAALLDGRHSAGLTGTYTVSEGFAELLRGQGLQARRQANGSYGLAPAPEPAQSPAPAPAADDATLPAVRVQAAGLADARTEGSGSYRARASNTATRLELSPRETPQTLAIVTRQQMDDQAMTSVDDVLNATSGVFVYDQGANGSNFYSRGHLLQAQFDGVPNPVGISESNRNPPIDSAFLDRVEVLQGASGLMSGAGEPGGVVNLVRKRATGTPQAHAELQLGSWKRRRLVGDVSGPLLDGGRLRGRLVAVADDGDSFVDFAYTRRRGAYGALEADLGPNTTLSASLQYQRDRSRDHLGVPFAADGSDLGLRRSAYFGNPHSQSNKDYRLLSVGLEHGFASEWTLSATFQRGLTHVDQSRDSWAYGDLDRLTGDGLQLYQTLGLVRDFRSSALDAHVSGPFRLFGRRHEAVLGVNGSRVDQQSEGAGYLPTDINVYRFDPRALPEPVAGSGYGSVERTTQIGTYGVLRYTLAERLKLIAGARVSRYEFADRMAGIGQKERGVVSPYGALVYDFDPQYTGYLSYSDIFKPQSSKEAGGGRLEPVLGANQELGLKSEWLDGRLTGAVALFRLDQTHLARVDESVPYDAGNACGGFCYVAADKVRSQGADLSLSGELHPGWNASAGYTYVNSRHASGEQDGQPYMSTLPRHSARLSTSYALPGGGWTLGGNLRVTSAIINRGSDYTIRRGGLALVGLAAKYRFASRTELGLVVDNLFDRRYPATVDSLWWTPFGDPRRLTLSLHQPF